MPKVIAIKNPTNGIVVIDKRFLVGKIEDIVDSDFFASSWTKALSALIVATALVASARPIATDIDLTKIVTTVAAMPAIGAEFELSDLARIAATEGL